MKEEVRQLILDFTNFVESEKDKLISYYKGNEEGSDKSQRAFDLLSRCNQVINEFMISRKSESTIEDWNILEMLTKIQSSLKKINNLKKFLRVSSLNGNFGEFTLQDITLNQFQTVKSLLEESNSDMSWVEFMKLNRLEEEGYTYQGGEVFKSSLPSNVSVSTLNSVVSEIKTVEDIYGRDINREVAFEKNDLSVLPQVSTLFQSADILSTLTKKSTLEFSEKGIDKSLFIGTYQSNFLIPIIFRQIFENFSTDDSFTLINIEGIETEGDSNFLYFKVKALGLEESIIRQTAI